MRVWLAYLYLRASNLQQKPDGFSRRWAASSSGDLENAVRARIRIRKTECASYRGPAINSPNARSSASVADPVILKPNNVAPPTMARDLASAPVGITGSQAEPLEGCLPLLRPTAARIAAKADCHHPSTRARSRRDEPGSRCGTHSHFPVVGRGLADDASDDPFAGACENRTDAPNRSAYSSHRSDHWKPRKPPIIFGIDGEKHRTLTVAARSEHR